MEGNATPEIRWDREGYAPWPTAGGGTASGGRSNSVKNKSPVSGSTVVHVRSMLEWRLDHIKRTISAMVASWEALEKPGAGGRSLVEQWREGAVTWSPEASPEGRDHLACWTGKGAEA